MDNFDYKAYLRSGKIYEDMDAPKVISEEKKYKQGYDDREDESLGDRRGAEKGKKDTYKARRDDSYGKFDKRDKEAKGEDKGPGRNKVNKENVGEVEKGYFKKEHGVGKSKKDSLKETIEEAYAKIQEGAYPFDQCLADNEGKYGEEGAKRVCGAIKAAYGEGLVKELDAVSWNDKNNPTKNPAVGERDPKKVGKSTAAYSVNEDARTDAEQEGYKDGMEDAKKDMEDAISKMKVSELKSKIREDIIEILAEQDEEVDVDVDEKEEVDVDVDVEDEVEVDAEGDDIEIERPAVKAKVDVGLSPEEEIVQDSLKAAMDAAESLGNDVLVDQIGNTITYFTRKIVVGDRSD